MLTAGEILTRCEKLKYEGRSKQVENGRRSDRTKKAGSGSASL
jgi:hypothetical protein